MSTAQPRRLQRREPRAGTTLAAILGAVSIPNPTDPANLAACNIQKPASVCDPDGVLTEPGVLRVASVLNDARSVSMPCGGGSAGVQVAVAAVRSARTAAFSEAAAVSGVASVLERWGVGDRRCNNGVALVLSVDDRKVAIKTGEGAKALLTDAEVQSIIVKMRPHLRGGDYAGAVLAAVGGIVDELRGVGGASTATASGGGYLEDLARLSVPVGIFGAFSFLSQWRTRHAAAATLRRIDTAYATATPSAALARPDAGPHCDICLRCPPDVPKVQCQPMACGHAVCQACRWRFGGRGARGTPHTRPRSHHASTCAVLSGERAWAQAWVRGRAPEQP